MRIAIVTATQKLIGGVETVTYMLQQTFEEAGHHVAILTADSVSQKNKSLGLKLIGLPYLTSSKYQETLHQYDLIIANGEFGWGISHPNAIVLFHGSYYGINKYLNKHINLKSKLHFQKDSLVQKWGARKKTVVAVSSFTGELLEEQGISVDHIIPNAIDTSRFKPTHQKTEQKYLCVANQYSRLDHYRKGIDILESLAKAGIDIDCISNNQVSSPLKWVQSIPQESMHTIYPKYRAVIFPSRFEANAIVPFEAMACGVPVVMSSVGYAKEIKKELPECIVEDWNPESYNKRLREIEANYRQLSERCRIFAEKHSMGTFKNNWLNLVDKLKS